MKTSYLAIAASALLFATNAHATIVSSISVTDGWFASDDTFTTFSSPETDIFLRTFGVPQFNRSALEFSLSNVTRRATIRSATFTIGAGGTSEAGANFNFYGYSGDGYITVADATRTSNFIGSLPTEWGWWWQGEKPLYTVDATDLVKQLVSEEANFAGFLITLAEEGPFTGAHPGGDLCSGVGAEWSFYCPVQYLPTLSVEYDDAVAVSEPNTIALLSVALAGLGAIRRRKSAM
jgi:hypothetical protein